MAGIYLVFQKIYFPICASCEPFKIDLASGDFGYFLSLSFYQYYFYYLYFHSWRDRFLSLLIWRSWRVCFLNTDSFYFCHYYVHPTSRSCAFYILMCFAMFYCNVLRLSVKKWKIGWKMIKRKLVWNAFLVHIRISCIMEHSCTPYFAVVYFPPFLLMKGVYDMLVLRVLTSIYSNCKKVAYSCYWFKLFNEFIDSKRQPINPGMKEYNRCFFLLLRVKSILTDFIKRTLSKISKFQFFASICSSPPRSTFPQRN